jgi:hypothetical protein
MNSILRAQQREQTWPFDSLNGSGSDYDIGIPIAPPPVPMSPHHRSSSSRNRQRTDSHHTIDIIPTFENPCRPCRSPKARSRSASSCFGKFKAMSPYLSVACFIAILVWEVSALSLSLFLLHKAHNIFAYFSYVSFECVIYFKCMLKWSILCQTRGVHTHFFFFFFLNNTCVPN